MGATNPKPTQGEGTFCATPPPRQVAKKKIVHFADRHIFNPTPIDTAYIIKGLVSVTFNAGQ